MYSVVYALDLYNCVYMYEVITVKKKKKLNFATSLLIIAISSCIHMK